MGLVGDPGNACLRFLFVFPLSALMAEVGGGCGGLYVGEFLEVVLWGPGNYGVVASRWEMQSASMLSLYSGIG